MAEAMSKEMGAPIDYATTVHASSGQSHIEDFILRLKNFKFEEIQVNSQSTFRP